MPGSDRPHIGVFGGGLSGITTATCFLLCGADVTIYTAERPDRIAPGSRDSSFASLYPAASVIPHSVSSPLVDRLTADSQIIFEGLAAAQIGEVWRQQHFEIFESPQQQPPSYADAMAQFAMLPDDGRGVTGAPRRPGAEGIFGWHFETSFVHVPTYVPWLYKIYEAAGGKVEIGRKTAEEMLRVKCDALINCAGLHGGIFGDDPEQALRIRGHLIRVFAKKQSSPIKLHKPVSWNYHPPAKVYANAQGEPADVYFYPRNEDLYLGGSRQEGRMQDGKLVWEQTVGEEIDIGGVLVPEPIWTLNRALIQQLWNIDIAGYEREGLIGFRPARTGPSSLRVEPSPEYPNLFHNLGHGGSGVTLSWGCAARLQQLVADKLGIAFPGVEPFRDANRHAAELNTMRELITKCVH